MGRRKVNPQDVYPKIRKSVKSFFRRTKSGKLQRVKSHLRKYPHKGEETKSKKVQKGKEAESTNVPKELESFNRELRCLIR